MMAWERGVQKIADTRVVRPYIGLTDAVRDAARLGLFCRQVGEAELRTGKAVTPRELRKISTNVREVAADPTRMGSSRIWSGAMSTTKFGDVIAQSSVHLIRAMANPAFYSVAATIMAYRMGLTMWAESRMGPEEAQRMREETAAWQWSAGFPMPKPSLWFDDRPLNRHDMMWVPLGMELGSVTNVGESIARGLVGVKTV